MAWRNGIVRAACVLCGAIVFVVGGGMMGDLVQETVRGIRARLKELAPVVAEYERLQAAYAALERARMRRT